MEQKTKIAVLGGGGKTGKYLVTQLLSQGYYIKLLLRNPEIFHFENPFLEIVNGDAIDPAAIHSLLLGCQAVINTVGQRKGEPLVAGQATINVLRAMKVCGIQRYILLAGINVDTPFDKKGTETKHATEWMKTNFPLIHADRQKAYSILSSSDVDWTLVRVPLIEFTDAKEKTIANVDDCKGNKISAADIAHFLTDQLTDITFIRKAPFIANV